MRAELPFATAVLSSIARFDSRWHLEGVSVPFSPSPFPWAHVALGECFRVSDLVAALWIGIVFHHQYLDQKIGKVSRDTELPRDLGLGS